MMNAQTRMKAKLETVGIPFDDIKVYGQQIMVRTRGRDSADKWARLLRQFAAKVHDPHQTVRENVVNKNTMLRPSKHTVWLVWARV